MRRFRHSFIVLMCLTVVSTVVAQPALTGYTTAPRDGDEILTSITVEQAGKTRIYDAGKLVLCRVVHYRSSGGVALALGAPKDHVPAAERVRLLDGRLTCGLPNPGSAPEPLVAAPVSTGEKATPGLGVAFERPLTNRPGPDVVLFEIHKGGPGDPFHVSPLKAAAGLHGITVRAYDVPATGPSAVELPPIHLYRFPQAPRSLEQFSAAGYAVHVSGEAGFLAAATAIDLSALGYPDGRAIEGLFFQSVSGRSSFDPVAILGLPAPAPENLLAAAPAPAPFRTEQTDLLKEALSGGGRPFDEIVFAQRVSGRDHWYGNFGHYCETESPYSKAALTVEGDMKYAFADGGRLCRFSLRTGEQKVLLDDPKGGVRDPNVHYDGRKVLFSYRKGGTKTFHLYEIGIDGKGLRQLTDGPDNDIEPIYTPDGGVVFCSSRCHRFVPCWRTQVATLYRCDGDGKNVRMLSTNAEQENTPWMMPDGRVLYMRWEYVDRHMLLYHHLWTVNPDGTGVMVYFGNQNPGGVMIDAKPIPNTRKVVASFSPGHGRREHEGIVAIIDPSRGPDDLSMMTRIGQRYFRDPYPLSENCFLVADGAGLHLLTVGGETQLLFRPVRKGARWDCHEPRPLRPRPREPIVPSRVAVESATGTLILSDIYEGRNMEGVKRGDIKKLLVLEQLPRPANFSNGQEPLTAGGTFMLERLLGTVPVEEDGSAYMELPSLKSLFFVALDENDLSVKRMQSFVTLQPGETASCVGCHEQRVLAPPSRPASTLAALARPPNRPVPFEGVPDVMDFPRDIQPILDRHCVACHRPDKRDGGVDLSGDRTPYFTTSYWTMFAHGLVSDGRNGKGNRPPRTIGSSASRLMSFLDGDHYDARLSQREREIVRLWIESGAVYPGTYGALGSGIHTVAFPEATVRRRCGSCHEASKPPYRNVKKGAVSFQFGKRRPAQPLLSDPYDIILIRHLAYFQLGEAPLHQALCNLDRPEKSVLLRAPLAKEAGGLQLCGEAVFADTADPDYREMLTAIRDASERLARHKRFDMPGFRPNRFYIREMQRYGVVPKGLPDDVPVDTYAVERAYWETFSHKPAIQTRGLQ